MKLSNLLLLSTVLLLTACVDQNLEWRGTNITGVMPDLRFELVSETGDAVTADQFSGKPALLFFGFTSCPDICPLTLQSVAQALKTLPADEQDDIRVLFVSVDPDRDDPQQLEAYTNIFGPQFVGLTGTQKQLKDLTKSFRAAYGYGEPDDSGYYDVSHSMALYGFDAEGQARVLLKNDEEVEDIAADMRQLLAL